MCDGPDSATSPWGTPWGQKPALLGVSIMSLPSGCVVVSAASSELPLRQQLPGSLNSAQRTPRGTRGNKAI